MTREQQINAAIAGLMAADKLRAAAGKPAPSTRSGMFGSGSPQPRLTLDPSCATVPEAHDPGVQTALLSLLAQSQSAQTRNPSGPPAVEYTMSGGPRIFDPGYDIAPARTNGWHDEVRPSDFGYPRGWANLLRGVWPDTFVAHSHPSFDLDPNFDQTDIKSHLPGVADLQIYADGTVRCLRGR